ncbi:MAG: lipoate--protein ligase family protein [Candidatus Aminicenantes bacterium]|nr:lipoate--protein ligase family protein [Candidatus Aminicenantes bacterium]
MSRAFQKEWELILDKKPLSGSLNMAVDDYLFQSLGDKPKTYLRFYKWEKPTVSLGYSQNIQKVVDVNSCQKLGIDIVRRMTGGKLVLHHKEVTYSLCSLDIKAFTSTLMDSYRIISQALMRGLEKMGLKPNLAETPPSSYKRRDLPCFSYPAQNEIEIKGKKIVGSAQKRAGSRFIQHGSIPLEKDEGLLESVAFLKREKSEERKISLSEALGKKVSFDWAVEYLISGISEFFEIILIPKDFNAEEKEAILKIQKEQYENSEWTFGGLSGLNFKP